jgi:dihydroorotate dehydrogenase (NAD+) catalytic subunit
MTTTQELTTRIGDLALANPVMTASGCGGAGPELDRFIELADLGAFVSRTITLDARPGSSGLRYAETASGFLTDTGLDNPGLHAFLASELPVLARQQVPTIVSITGRTLGEYAELARRAGGAPGVVALEVSFLDEDPYAAGKAFGVVRRDAPRGIAVLAKLTGAHLDLARELARNGVDAIVVGHSPQGLAIDPATLAAAIRGGLSGPAVGPLALRAVWAVHEAVPEIPIVGVGGIRTGAEALAMIAAGACAVQVGTAVLHDPSAPTRILAELREGLSRLNLTLAEAVGIAHRGGLSP